jgi:hypothetical protein
MKNLGPMVIGIIIGALVTYFAVPKLVDAPGDAPEGKITKPKGTISIAKATELSNNWAKYRKPAVDSCARAGGQKQDDRNVSWSLKELQEYIRYAKHESKKLGYEMTGIRVNLGVYGAHATPECRNLTTMFIEPIGHKAVSKASSLNLNLNLQYGGIPVPPHNRGHGGGDGYP